MAKKMGIAEALREGIAEEMRRDSKVFCIGEDIAVPGGWGGAFTVTLGLEEEFPDRMIDTPIAELGFFGIACGAAMMGMRPIADVQYGDFLLLATDQIINNTSTADQVTNKLETANLAAWNQIASMVTQIQNMAQFNAKNPQQKQGAVGTGAFSTVQQAQGAINKAGINQAKLAALQTILKSAGPIKTGTLNPSQKNLLQAIGVQLK